MCLYVQRQQKGEWTAKKDIPVWKVLLTNHHSVFRGFIYKPNTTVHIEKMSQSDLGGSGLMISEGFHAYRSTRSAVGNMLTGDIIVKMTIPIGAKYYIGMYGEIVSDTLVTGDMIPIVK